MAVLDPRKRGTTKFDLEAWFRTHKPEARVNAMKGPKPYHRATDNPEDPMTVVPFPSNTRYRPSEDFVTEEEEHDIGWAVEQLCQGLRVTRPAYHGSYIGLQEPDSANSEPYIFVEGDGNRVPVSLQNGDLLALDWELAD